jgi:hypothetical protein
MIESLFRFFESLCPMTRREASCFSRGAAIEFSPTRKRGVEVSLSSQLRRSVRFRDESYAPAGAGCLKKPFPTGLRPWLHSVAAPRLERLRSRRAATVPESPVLI